MKPTLDKAVVGALVDNFAKWQDEWLDKHVSQLSADAARQHRPVRCHKGCGTCCSIWVSIGAPDAFRIARFLMDEHRDTPELRQKLLSVGDTMDRTPQPDYHGLGVPCVFLRPEGYCSIYRVRPTICRLLLSVSPSEHCAWKSGHKIDVVSTETIRAANQTRLEQFSKAAWVPVAGVLPLMVLWGLQELERLT